MTIAAIGKTDSTSVHLLSLAAGMAIMLGGTLYPLMLTNPAGKADHGLATLLFWAMSSGFIRGVGFVPDAPVWRWLFSGQACTVALVLAGLVKLMH